VPAKAETVALIDEQAIESVADRDRHDQIAPADMQSVSRSVGELNASFRPQGELLGMHRSAQIPARRQISSAWECRGNKGESSKVYQSQDQPNWLVTPGGTHAGGNVGFLYVRRRFECCRGHQVNAQVSGLSLRWAFRMAIPRGATRAAN
jgi:hypothetical protein